MHPVNEYFIVFWGQYKDLSIVLNFHPSPAFCKVIIMYFDYVCMYVYILHVCIMPQDITVIIRSIAV